MSKRPSKVAADATPVAQGHRSGAVARMLRMPVATLRVWERRYGLTNTEPSPGGQRRYTAEDVRRLALLKQLVDLGHAIGSLASLDMAQLKAVAATHAQAWATTEPTAETSTSTAVPAGSDLAWRLVVVGPALAARLQRSSLLRQLGRPVELLGPFTDAEQAARALSAAGGPRPADAWLLHEPQLHADWLAGVEAATSAARPGAPRVPTAVLYGFGTEGMCEALAARGVALLREPQPDVVVGQWLGQWLGQWAQGSERPVQRPAPGRGASSTVTPRRWDDAALSGFAALSTSVACECPRHVAELLLQLSHFEDYSAQCEQRSAADAALHAYLARISAEARVRFESALEHVALHEGLLLPPSVR